MQIQNTYNPTQFTQQLFSLTHSGKTSLSPSESSEENTKEYSPLLAFSSQYDLSESSFSSTETAFVYRKDNSLALMARREVDIQLKQERFTIEATLSAESLGLTAKDFEAYGNKPIEFPLSFKQSDLQVKYQKTTAERKTLRKPDEILQDLLKSLTSVLKEKGNKNIAVLFDDEALQLLMQDERFAKIMQDVINLINILNQLKIQEGERKNYTIKLSGKGAPYIDQEESLSVNGSETSIDFKVTILPPQTEEKSKVQLATETAIGSGADEAQTTQPTLNLSV